MGPLVRGAIIVLGLVFMLAGLATVMLARDSAGAGLWTVAVGAFLVVVPLLERQRYRSEAAEKDRGRRVPGAAKPPAICSNLASVRPPRSSSTPRPAIGCGSSWTRRPGSGATSPRADGGAGTTGDSFGPEEVELKLTVLDPAAIRELVLDPAAGLPGVVPLGPARSLDVEDRYLDTAGGTLRAAGLVARIRTSPGGRRLTVKSLVRRGAGAVHRRLELEGDAGAGDDPRVWPPSDARDRLLDTVGGDPLTALATLRQRRLQRDFAVGSSVVELSLDDVGVAAQDGRTDRWTELECELRSGDEADLAVLGAILAGRPGLEPATTSKLDRALATDGNPFTER